MGVPGCTGCVPGHASRWPPSSPRVAGCGPGSGEGLDENGRPIGEDGGAGALVPTFGSIQANVFTPTCAVSGCHTGAAAPLGLRLDAGSSYALLVGVPSEEVPGWTGSTPGDPDDSYVIHKLEGTQAVGERMPFGGPFLPQETIDVIRQWIADGALPDSDAPDVPPTVVSVEPADGATLDAFPARSRSSSARTWTRRSSTSRACCSPRAAATAASTTATKRRSRRPPWRSMRATRAAPSWISPGVAAGADSYELRLASDAIADLDGEVLDGDGDGASGPDFVGIFVVTDVRGRDAAIDPGERIHAHLLGLPQRSAPARTSRAARISRARRRATTNLVDVPSIEHADLLRVDPGQRGRELPRAEARRHGGARRSHAARRAAALGGDHRGDTRVDRRGRAFRSGPTTTPRRRPASRAPARSRERRRRSRRTASDDVGVHQRRLPRRRRGSAPTDSRRPTAMEWDTTEVADGEHAHHRAATTPPATSRRRDQRR